jgi:hypothetical protein
VLGYRRLRVIDLATGDQPVANEADDVVVVFNGEIYNFRELRADLESHGHVLTGTGDTPALPHLYEEYGDRFVDKLDGCCAGALGQKSRASSARTVSANRSSTHSSRTGRSRSPRAEALLAFPGVDRRVDLARLDAYLALGTCPERRRRSKVCGAFTSSIHTVEAAACRSALLVSEPRRLDLTDAEWIGSAPGEDAVRKRLIADVYKALLSG